MRYEFVKRVAKTRRGMISTFALLKIYSHLGQAIGNCSACFLRFHGAAVSLKNLAAVQCVRRPKKSVRSARL